MKKAIKECKVCGKKYEYCHTQRKDGDVFRWQDVACCAEHGAEYFKSVMIARGELIVPEEKTVQAPKAAGKKATKVVSEE